MGRAPENTPASFDLARRLGADVLECDVHLTRDRRLVVIHDESLDRTTSGTGLVKDAPWSQVKRLDAGGWYHRRFRGQRVPDLPSLLAWLKDKKALSGAPLRLLIEIKNEPVRYAGIADAVAACLKDAGMTDRAGVISFDHGAVKRAKRLAPSLFTGLLFHEPLPDAAARLRWTGADGLFPRRHLVDARLVRWAKRRKVFLGTWTVNDPAEMKKMIGLGLDGIATNHPDLLAALLKTRLK
ncbi:MAG: glycerophosphodiester phosphodiesterase [Elusimicrobiota bacterium]